jgi:aldose 1-epimerase
VSGRTDLRRLERLGAPGLDDCFTGLTGGDFRMIYPESGVEVRFHVDPIFTHAVIYAPNDERGAPRDFFCVEPVTNANDGFNLLARGVEGTGVKLLEPGERWGGAWELSAGDL